LVWTIIFIFERRCLDLDQQHELGAVRDARHVVGAALARELGRIGPQGRERVAGQIVAFLGLVHDASFIGEAVTRSAFAMAPFLVAAVLAFGALVFLLLRGSVVTRLRRLVEAAGQGARDGG
jgi:hypothetical protein